MPKATRPIDHEELLSHVARLRGLARRLVADESRADDVVEQGMLAAIEKPPREGVASLMTSARTLPYVHASTIFGTLLHLLVDRDVSNETIDADLEAFGISYAQYRALVVLLDQNDMHISELARRLRVTRQAALATVSTDTWAMPALRTSSRTRTAAPNLARLSPRTSTRGGALA